MPICVQCYVTQHSPQRMVIIDAIQGSSIWKFACTTRSQPHVIMATGVAVGGGFDASAAARAAVASASAIAGPQLMTCQTCSVRLSSSRTAIRLHANHVT